MACQSTRRRHRVVVIALDGVIPFEFSIPARLFGAARDKAGQPLYEVVTASVDGGHVRTNSDFMISPGMDLSALGSADTIVVPAVEVDELDPRQVDVVIEALRRRRQGARIMSICTGAQLVLSSARACGETAT
ncbi:putative transcriptional regulator, AraC family [Parafrankia sp. EAN1pec]|uniref:DJ-1/PfpI family protein n=1 Tax=Parafrankia sp. (strain EAN1pec) TaxID=298653 RepID=UPI00005422B7|nr:putative transcriptional regulator, AraC family [Frankia sp. EAN1pec]